MTRIAIDVRMVRSSGIGTVVSNITSQLIALRPDWQFQLLGDPEKLSSIAWTSAPNVKITPFTAPIYSIGEQIAWSPMALGACDLVWSPNYNIPLRWRGPLLTTIHDVAHLALPDIHRGMAKRLYASVMFGQVRRRADAIIYVSQFSAEEFHRVVGNPRKAHETVAHLGVSRAWSELAKNPPARPYLLFVGNVKPHKNLKRLLLAFASVMDTLPHELVIAGRHEGFITGDDSVAADAAALGARVRFTGELSDQALKQLVADSDALVLPSLYEGFGLPPVEAMAAGCPVLVSRAASLPEVCGDAALYCDPLDVADIAAGLKRILSDQDLRNALREKGLARAHTLTWESCARHYERAISRLLPDAAAP